jgi:2',3'-cyclic-nucleotide 2'-phosphodiesterase (5'-nucleotidase family)
MSRVATIRNELLAENPNTFTVLAGDFLNPSLLGTMKHEGERIRGKQMVELMNAVGVDLVVLGNHEFDLNENDLQKRINESEFTWVSTNYQQLCGDKHYPFYKEVNGEKEFFPKYDLWNISDTDGTEATIGFLSATLEETANGYTYYEDYTEKAQIMMDSLQKIADFPVAITHLSIEQDKQLARDISGIPLILGGHDHTNMRFDVNGCRITKADANAKTVYIHRISKNMNTGEYTIDSELKHVDTSVPFEPKTNALVSKWNQILEENISSIIPNPFDVIYTVNKPLDGKEHTVRYKQCNLGSLITESMLWSMDGKYEAAILNSGGIRIDDEIHGNITAVDIFRALPYGGAIYRVEMKGSLLKGVLDYGEKVKGNGAYLQRTGIDYKDGEWHINNKRIKDDQNYWIVMNDFLMAGRDIHFLSPDNKGVFQVLKPETDEEFKKWGDLRKCIVAYLKSGEYNED